jgi:hypothetical protein
MAWLEQDNNTTKTRRENNVVAFSSSNGGFVGVDISGYFAGADCRKQLDIARRKSTNDGPLYGGVGVVVVATASGSAGTPASGGATQVSATTGVGRIAHVMVAHTLMQWVAVRGKATRGGG